MEVRRDGCVCGDENRCLWSHVCDGEDACGKALIVCDTFRRFVCLPVQVIDVCTGRKGDVEVLNVVGEEITELCVED